MAKDEVTEVQPGGGVDGERDPLTVGLPSHGEDVKGSSTHNQDTAEVKKSTAKTDKTVKDQKVADKKADKAAEKAASN